MRVRCFSSLRHVCTVMHVPCANELLFANPAECLLVFHMTRVHRLIWRPFANTHASVLLGLFFWYQKHRRVSPYHCEVGSMALLMSFSLFLQTLLAGNALERPPLALPAVGYYERD